MKLTEGIYVKAKKWDRCLYCDASIKGDDAHVAALHDPYCPHGKSLHKFDERGREIDHLQSHVADIAVERDSLSSKLEQRTKERNDARREVNDLWERIEALEGGLP